MQPVTFMVKFSIIDIYKSRVGLLIYFLYIDYVKELSTSSIIGFLF